MRPFGKVYSSVWYSQRFRALPDDGCRLAYLYILTCEQGTSIGTFRFSPDMMATEMRIDRDEARRRLTSLVDVALVRYDDAEAVLQIVGFLELNRFTNRNHLLGSLRIFDRLPNSSCLKRSVAADLVVCIVQSSAEWEENHKARQAFASSADKLVRRFDLVPILAQIDDSDLRRDLSKELLIDLSNHRDRDREKDRDRDRDREYRREKPLPVDVASNIETLRAKAVES